MQRKDLIQSFFKSMDAMARINMMQGKGISKPKHLPPHGQMGILFVVAHAGPQSIKDLSTRFSMTSSAATQLVNNLVKDGLLARTEDPADRRKSCVELTAKGKKIITEAKEHRLKKMMTLFEPLTDEELSQLLKIQNKIVEHWETTCKNIQKQ
jgi:DNA-binding MarR family transcriptional regulator